MNETIEITIPVVDEGVREQLIAQFSVNGFDAFEERDDELACFIDISKYNAVILENMLSPYNLPYKENVIAAQNWNALWESNFAPVIIDDFYGIRADFHPNFTDVKNEIVITPKMSFGTGHHATTYMMISEMQKLDFKNKEVADFGTGTGVLAILAEKLGSKRIWAIDVDDWSIENATENVEKNGCKNITIEKKDRFSERTAFDIILANINKNVILSNAAALAASTVLNGFVLVSGLLKEDESEVVASFLAFGFKLKSMAERSKWVCLLFQNS